MARRGEDAIERTVEDYFVREVERRGWEERKLDARKGDPDRLLIAPEGFCAFIEFKRPSGGVVSDAQSVTLSKLVGLGQHAYVCRTKERVDEILRFVEQLVKLRSLA